MHPCTITACFSPKKERNVPKWRLHKGRCGQPAQHEKWLFLFFLWSEYTYLDPPPCIIHVCTRHPGGLILCGDTRHKPSGYHSFQAHKKKPKKKKDEIKLPHALEFQERSMVCAERYDIPRLPSINGWVEVRRDRHTPSLMEVWGEGLLL